MLGVISMCQISLQLQNVGSLLSANFGGTSCSWWCHCGVQFLNICWWWPSQCSMTQLTFWKFFCMASAVGWNKKSYRNSLSLFRGIKNHFTDDCCRTIIVGCFIVMLHYNRVIVHGNIYSFNHIKGGKISVWSRFPFLHLKILQFQQRFVASFKPTVLCC